MVVAADHFEKDKANYEKNYMKAEAEASKIMSTTTENELQGLNTALIPSVKQEPPKPVIMQAP